MTYREAKKLRNEDEVTIKETGDVVMIIEIYVYPKTIDFFCDDGSIYRHTEVK